MLNLLIDRVLIGDDLLTASFPLLFQRVKVQAKQNKNKNNNKHGKNHLPVQCVNSYNILKTFMEACQKGDNFECHCLKYFFSTVNVLRRIILCVVGCFCGDNVCISKYILSWSAWVVHCNTHSNYWYSRINLFGNSFIQWLCLLLFLPLIAVSI